MNKKQELQLEYAAASLTRADQANNLQGMAAAHKIIKEAVADIYKGKIDVPTVLRVEEILNDGQANVLGKSESAYKDMEMLAGQAESGFRLYNLFTKEPQKYVQMAYATRDNVKKRNLFIDKIPYDPVRSALTEFREQLAKELTPRKGNPFPDSKETDRMRLDATVKVERDYLTKILDHRPDEPKQKKQEHLQDFDKRMEKLIRGIEPRQQEKQPEPPKQQEESPKRSRGMSR